VIHKILHREQTLPAGGASWHNDSGKQAPALDMLTATIQDHDGACMYHPTKRQLRERFFDTALEAGCYFKENEFPLVIAFSDRNKKVVAVLTISELGHVLPGLELEWNCSGWIWQWQDLTHVESPFRAVVTSRDGRTRTAKVPRLRIKEETGLLKDRDRRQAAKAGSQ
jgi:hypothetical protein